MWCVIALREHSFRCTDDFLNNDSLRLYNCSFPITQCLLEGLQASQVSINRIEQSQQQAHVS